MKEESESELWTSRVNLKAITLKYIMILVNIQRDAFKSVIAQNTLKSLEGKKDF